MVFLMLLVPTDGLQATEQRDASQSGINPIRKVVTLLQSMQKKVMAEGETEEELFKKFMCYCKTGSGNLRDSISAAEAKIGELATEVAKATEQKAQLEEGLQQDRNDRAAAKKTMADATAQRNKEAG